MAKKDSVAMLEAKIEVLTRARAKIKSGNQIWVCYAIGSVEHNYPDLLEAACELTCYIEKVLGRGLLLSSWIRSNKMGVNCKSYDDESMRKARLQWMDWMIQCLKEDLALKQQTSMLKGVETGYVLVA